MISQKPGDQDDYDTDDDDPNAPPDPDEKASYTVTCTGTVRPAVEIADIDICGNQLAFKIMPTGLAPGDFTVSFRGKQGTQKPVAKRISMRPLRLGGSDENQAVPFDWSQFPDDEFRAASVKIAWKNLTAAVEDVLGYSFTCYGEFTITKFYTPLDTAFGPPDTVIPKDVDEKVTVNAEWAREISSNEGVGVFQGNLVLVHRDKKTGGLHLFTTEKNGSAVSEGRYKTPLQPQISVAINERDLTGRFRDPFAVRLYFDGLSPNCKQIDDTGNWDWNSTGKKRLDLFQGRGGKALGQGNVSDGAYVIKVLTGD